MEELDRATLIDAIEAEVAQVRTELEAELRRRGIAPDWRCGGRRRTKESRAVSRPARDPKRYASKVERAARYIHSELNKVVSLLRRMTGERTGRK